MFVLVGLQFENDLVSKTKLGPWSKTRNGALGLKNEQQECSAAAAAGKGAAAPVEAAVAAATAAAIAGRWRG